MLFQGQFLAIGQTNYDVSPDGKRFLMVKPRDAEPKPTNLYIVLNWFEELKRRAGTGKK